MAKTLTFKLGMRFKNVKTCFIKSKQQELKKPGDQLVFGWTIVEVNVKFKDVCNT